MDLNIKKMTNHPPSPGIIQLTYTKNPSTASWRDT